MLRCAGIRKLFGGALALDDVSLQFTKSSLTAIIGPNGAGKTTLFHILTGFLRPDAGQCFLDGREITNFAPYRIARLGVGRTFQNLRVISRMSALENVLLARPTQRGEGLIGALIPLVGGGEERANRAIGMEYLRQVGLEAKASDMAAELSYGEQKLLSIACCLATEAQVLLLDEPVSGVHPEIAKRVFGLLIECGQRGKLIVFIEHDLQAVSQVAELVVVMDRGRVIGQGPPKEVMNRREIMGAYFA